MKKHFAHSVTVFNFWVIKIWKKALLHKKISSAIVVVLVIGLYFGGSALFGAGTEARYVLASVKKGSVEATISGSGQVSASNQTEVKAKVSGNVVYLGAVNGQEVKAGDLILQLDSRDAGKAVRDAEVNLESARLSLQKIKQPADNLSIIQSENSLTQAKQAKQNAEDNLKKAYEDSYSAVSNAFLDLPTIMQGLDGIVYGKQINSLTDNVYAYADLIDGYDDRVLPLRDDVVMKYQIARKAYDKNFDTYKTITRSSSTTTLETLVAETYETTKNIAEVVKGMSNLIDFVKDISTQRNLNTPAVTAQHQSSLSSYTSKTNSHLASLSSVQSSVKSSRDSIVNSERSVLEKTESLAKLKEGSDALDIESSELSLRQRENALLDAREKYADYYIRAPFNGTVAKVSVKKGDEISSGAALVTFITKQKVVDISLNEVDIAKVKIGNLVTLTFDAIEGLSLKGQVAEIDSIGTVTQGVVTYAVKIVFDGEDIRIKPGMSVSATIITEIRNDVLRVSNGAIKSRGNMQYVEVFDEKFLESPQGVTSTTAPRQQRVEVGLANDNFTEITSGLNEGDQIVVRTIQVAATKTTTTAPSLFPTGGARTGAGTGGAVRINR